MTESRSQKEIGFLNINKPTDWTSHDVVAKLRKILGIKKIGHSGTLDPFATGVLVIGINDATRLFEYLPSDKEYIAEVKFGIRTSTDDITGEIIETNDYVPQEEEINKHLKRFCGKIKQKPPIYSSININGKRAYDLARENNIKLEDIKEKEVEVYSIDVISYTPLCLKIHCSSGTYIRSIARDLGISLNTCATLSKLQRIKIGNRFKIEDSKSLEDINQDNSAQFLLQAKKAVELKTVVFSSDQIKDIVQGKETKASADLKPWINKELLILDNSDRLISVGFLTSHLTIKPKKVFIK